jgi:hypothetical protein
MSASDVLLMALPIVGFVLGWALAAPARRRRRYRDLPPATRRQLRAACRARRLRLGAP